MTPVRSAGQAAQGFGAFGSRLLIGLVGGTYAAFLLLTYRELSKVWGYLGFWYQPPDTWVSVTTICASALLGMLLPLRSWTVVGFAKWVLYFILFIPALTIPPQQGVLPYNDLLLLEVLIWASAAVLIVLLRDGTPFHEIRIAPRFLMQVVIAAWLLGNIAIFAVFGGSMSLAGLDEVYEQRATAATASSAAISYVMGTMSGAINPFLLVVGLSRRRPYYVAMALAGQLVIYSTLAGKVVLGSTLLMIGSLLVFRHGKVAFARIYATVLAFAVMGPFITTPRVAGGLINAVSDLVYFRILVLPGVLVGAYSSYFLDYPVTYLSHSLIGRPFSTYPYGELSVGQVIGRYVTPGVTVDAKNYNANFIAADGIAGFSTWGVPVIFLLAAGWLWLMSKLVGQENRPIVCAMLMPFVVSLADASLFTAILTGGGAAAAILLYLFRSAEYAAATDHDIMPSPTP
ncbi:hypothetical protein [uncultured Sphingomonas sp.]|uniref:hypothetical protein n=1 Tax=uncultured Sphingomonas sp. TaxID=158754 RepID=UPI0035C9FF31